MGRNTGNDTLGKQFLKINYEVRGGSNFELGNSLIICVSKDKLFEALHILRYTDWESDVVATCNVRLHLVNAKGRYLLTTITKDKLISTNNPETNYNYTSNSTLHFDKNLKVFYSIKDNLFDTLKVCYHDLTYNRAIEGNFPKVFLEKQQYFYRWAMVRIK